jgi:coenzyme F420 hydrogenase subunit beta
VCGGNGIDWEGIHQWRFGEPYGADPLGRTLGVFTSYACDVRIRDNSASGGSVTALLCHALASGTVDAAAVSFLNGVEPCVHLARAPDQIRAAAGCIYYSNPALTVLKDLRAFPGKVAFVGLPCHIVSLNKAMKHGVISREKVAFTISLVCGRTARFDLMRTFLRRMGIDPDLVKEVRMRGGGWPGTFRVTLKDERQHVLAFPHPVYMSMWKFYQFAPPYCLLCSDPLGTLADITSGDAWLPEFAEDRHGRSILIARTSAAEELLRSAQRASVITLEDLPRERVLAAQRQQVFGKLLNQRAVRRVFSFTKRLTGWPLPKDTGEDNWRKPSWFGWGYAAFQFMNCTLSASPRWRWLLRCMPLVTLVKAMRKWRAGVGGGGADREKTRV